MNQLTLGGEEKNGLLEGDIPEQDAAPRIAWREGGRTTMTPVARQSYTGNDSDELMSMFAVGDQQGYDLLYKKWSGALFWYFRGHTHDPVRSADLTQATFFKVWKQRQLWPGFKAKGGGFRPWLFTLAHNELIDDYRAEVRNLASPGSKDPKLTLINRSGDYPTPEEYLMGKEIRNPIRICLSQLDPLEAQVLKSRIFEEQTLEQVGSVIWPEAPRFTAVTNASRTLRKALLQLKRCLVTKGVESIVDLPPCATDGGEEEV